MFNLINLFSDGIWTENLTHVSTTDLGLQFPQLPFIYREGNSGVKWAARNWQSSGLNLNFWLSILDICKHLDIRL